MLRSLLIYFSKAEWARRLVTRWKIAWSVASRFVAGETPEEAIQAIKILNAKGICATLDHLGENVTSADEARQATEEILHILDEINRAEVQSGISIKLSQIGLLLDEEICEENLRLIVERAHSQQNFVRIDMEDSPVTQITLDLFNKMRRNGYADTVGIVIQSYLFRSDEDVRQLMAEGAKVRLCKGAYKEPADIAYPSKADVDTSFDRLTRMMIDGAMEHDIPRVSACGRFPPIPAIASHDEARVDYAKAYAEEVGFPKNALEFQMLHGIRRDLQDQLAAEGYPVRVYVPYGTEWYPYFVRRLAERPANLWFFISNLIRG
ncbi:MAG: proline dehydrogenase family protein [Anaerolineales bacterium]|nr:proline dehydrogenase family protein [Chloroflexota bacterium]MBL6982591.1 proline dehydrogenase family protein [Anaerolineales bacterium]